MDWKKWTSLVVVGLMLLGMVAYIVTNDEAEPEAPLDRVDPAAAREMKTIPAEQAPAAPAEAPPAAVQ